MYKYVLAHQVESGYTGGNLTYLADINLIAGMPSAIRTMLLTDRVTNLSPYTSPASRSSTAWTDILIVDEHIGLYID